MKRIKRIMSYIIASTMTIILTTQAYAVEYGVENKNQPTKTYSQKFEDVQKSHWAFNYIAEMAEKGILSGYPNGKFYPQNNITRAEFSKVMTIAAGLSLDNGVTSFVDVDKDAWFAPYVKQAMPYLNGYNTGTGLYYRPNQLALREDITVAMVKLKGYSTDGADESVLSTMFTDYESISKSARRYVAAAVERGIISGYDDDTFRGQESISRAEAAAILWRAFQYGNDNKEFGNDIKPTIKPTEYVTPKPTEAPTPTPTIEPTEEPTFKPTPTPTPEPADEKGWYVYSVASNVDIPINRTFRYITYDSINNLVYYYDQQTNVISYINLSTDKVKEYIDCNKVYRMIDSGKYVMKDPGDSNGDYYKNMTVEDIRYDNYRDRLYIELRSFAKSDIDGLNDIPITERFVVYIDSDNSWHESSIKGIHSFCENGIMTREALYDPYTENLEWKFEDPMGYELSDILVSGNNLYALRNGNSYEAKVFSNNISEMEWKETRGFGKLTMGGWNSSNFYVWERGDDKIVKITPPKKLSVLLSLDDVEITDFKPIKPQRNNYIKMIVTEDEECVVMLIDNTFRILRKR